MNVRFCLQHCHDPLHMPEAWPIKLCHVLYISNSHCPVHTAYAYASTARCGISQSCFFSVHFVAKWHILQQKVS